MEAASSQHAHPKLLDALARLHHQKVGVVEKIALNVNCAEETRTFLIEKGLASFVPPAEAGPGHDLPETNEEFPEVEGDEPVDEDSEAFKSKYQLSQIMGVPEKIKIAQTGDKEWRMILIRDSNKLVSGTVIKNPRITEAEVLAIAKSAVQNDEILRVICTNKEWMKNYQIRKSLVENNKTALPTALRLLSTLTEKDLAQLAKSKNITTVLSTQARKLILQKKNK